MDIPMAQLLGQLAARQYPPPSTPLPATPSQLPRRMPTPTQTPTQSYPPLVGRPARPYTPTPPSIDDLTDALYGPQAAPAPLPSYLPPNVQTYIRNHPSYSEGDPQGPGGQYGAIYGALGQEPTQPANPQIGDLQRLFRGSIMRNAPSSNQLSGKTLGDLIRMGVIAGGENI